MSRKRKRRSLEDSDEEIESKKKKTKAADRELDALQDMTKNPESTEQNEPAEGVDGSFSGVPDALQDMTKNPESTEQNEPAEGVDGSFSGVPEDQITLEQIAQAVSKMVEAIAQVLKEVLGDDSVPEPTSVVADPAVQGMIDEVSAAILQTLQNLNTNAESLQTPLNDQDLANMFSYFNLPDGGGQDGNMFVPFVRGIMQFLLSKEVLYPPLMELVDMYEAWLAENKGKIEQTEYDRFSKQQELMQQVCAVLEPEQESDPEDVKWQRFLTVLDLLLRLEDLGDPPTDIAELVDDIVLRHVVSSCRRVASDK